MRDAELIRKSLRARHHLKAGTPVGSMAIHSKDVAHHAEREVVVIANTDDVDLDNEIVLPSGADTTYFEDNQSVFLDHMTDSRNHVGTMRKLIKVMEGDRHRAWKVPIGLLKLPGNSAPDDVLARVKQSALGVSIGFEPLEYGPPTDEESAKYGAGVRNIIRKWKWLELSFTALPCNVPCRSVQHDGGGKRRVFVFPKGGITVVRK